MADQVKGLVTPLASMFPAEEAQKAAKRVQDVIAERQQELEHLCLFASDNTSLINFVQRLPDELSHDIMVPFGKAAFFPGHLIHTNEFLVLLGVGYYAERTAKQTVEILQRQGTTLEHQVVSLKGMMTDLEAEANFFNAAAVEAEEGLVEIREDYFEEPITEEEVESGISTVGDMNITDEEYARIQSRLDELEREELAAECTSSDDNDDNAKADSSFLHPLDDHDIIISMEKQLEDSRRLSKGKEVLPSITSQPIVPKIVHNESSREDLNQQYNAEECHSYTTSLEHNKKHSQVIKHPKNDADNASGQALRKAFTGSVVEHSHDPSPRKSAESSTQAFTSSVVEHGHGPSPSMSTHSTKQPSSSNPLKPVSRFKMQRGNC